MYNNTLAVESLASPSPKLSQRIICYNYFRELYPRKFVNTDNLQSVAKVLSTQTASRLDEQCGKLIITVISVVYYILHTILYEAYVSTITLFQSETD